MQLLSVKDHEKFQNINTNSYICRTKIMHKLTTTNYYQGITISALENLPLEHDHLYSIVIRINSVLEIFV